MSTGLAAEGSSLQLRNVRSTENKHTRETGIRMAYATLVSVDGWRNSCGGWDWNDQRKLKEYTREEAAHVIARDKHGRRSYARKLFAFLRAEGYLSDASKGRVRVDVAGSDPDYLTIEDRHTGEPIFAFIVDYDEAIEDPAAPSLALAEVSALQGSSGTSD